MTTVQGLYKGKSRILRFANEISQKQRRAYQQAATKSKHNENISIAGVTIINDVKGAVSAVAKLLQLPNNRSVAWTAQFAKSSQNQLLLSAYGGNDLDFGNGPHLVFTNLEHSEQKKVASALRGYFADSICPKIWFDVPQSYQALKTWDIIPQGFQTECVYAAELIRQNRLSKDIKALAKNILTKGELEKARNIVHAAEKDETIDSSTEISTKSQTRPKREEKYRKEVLDIALDAKTVLILNEKLQKTLRQECLHGVNALSSIVDSVYNLETAYSEFFQPVIHELGEIERRGVEIDVDELEQLKIWSMNEQNQCYSLFREWAVQHSPNAKHIHLNSVDQMRQLLFAPCSNIYDKTRKLPSKRTFSIDKQKGTRKKVTNQDNNSKEFTIEGLGIKPKVHLKDGWPSTGLDALREAAETDASIPNNLKTGDISFKDAVEHLERAVWMKHSLEGLNKHLVSKMVKNRVQLPSSICTTSGSIKHISTDKNWESFFRKTMRAAPGNILATVEYTDLELRVLGQLSGCKNLQNRLNSNTDIHMIVASSLYRQVLAALHGTGETDMLAGTETSRDLDSIREQFRDEYDTARFLDWGAVKGRNIAAIVNRTGWKRQYAEEMMRCWDEMHPYVEKWRQELGVFAQKNGYVETMMGRRIPVKKTRGRKRELNESTLVDTAEKVISATAGEVVMGSILKLASNEKLNTLGWNVIFVDHNCLILDGPVHSRDIAIDLIANDTLQPFTEDLDVDLLMDLSWRSADE